MSLHGFEIRLELLKMAKEMLEQDWHAQRAMIQTQWEQQVNLLQIKAQAKDSLIDSIPAVPTFQPFPSEEDVIKKAKALNEFIAQRA
jgi:hypothetical protein